MLLSLLLSKRNAESRMERIGLPSFSNGSLGMASEIRMSSAPSAIFLEFACEGYPSDHSATLKQIGESTMLRMMNLVRANALPISKASLTAGDYLVMLSADEVLPCGFRVSSAAVIYSQKSFVVALFSILRDFQSQTCAMQCTFIMRCNSSVRK